MFISTNIFISLRYLLIYQLEEKGPYIYTTESVKVDVKFENDRVTSKTFDKAKFNKTLTAKECPKCNENDQVCYVKIKRGLTRK